MGIVVMMCASCREGRLVGVWALACGQFRRLLAHRLRHRK